MKQAFPTIFAIVASVFLVTGCLTPKYDKIPLEKGEIPYILADGDYTDVNGNVHANQHNVWAMQEADVYDYVRGLVPSRNQRGFMDGLRKLKEIDGKALLIGALVLLSAFLGIKLIVVKRKNKPDSYVGHDSDEDEED